MLAFSSHFDSRRVLTAWSSGTGFAGMLGVGWVVLLTEIFHASFEITLILSLIIPCMYCFNFEMFMSMPQHSALKGSLSDTQDGHISLNTLPKPSEPSMIAGHDYSAVSCCDQEDDNKDDMALIDRFYAVLSLWPYTIPLFLVYFAEYAMQAGVWSAIGFPLNDKAARDHFYVYSNWTYQLGVLLSRSSGTLWRADMAMLWALPAAQVCLLLFFIWTAIYQIWYNWWLLVCCGVVGLIGGAVYVQAFALLSENAKPQLREFSLAAAGVADSLGIALSTSIGIYIQKFIYNHHNISEH